MLLLLICMFGGVVKKCPPLRMFSTLKNGLALLVALALVSMSAAV